MRPVPTRIALTIFALAGWTLAGVMLLNSPSTMSCAQADSVRVSGTGDRAPTSGNDEGGIAGMGCAPCLPDINHSGSVDVDDLIAVILGWGPCIPADFDCDGYTVAQGDCNDGNPAVHPGAVELCNSIDDDCDNQIDEGFNFSIDFDNCGGCGISCDDGLACTIDSCVAGQCNHVIMNGFCVINNQCVAAGTVNPSQPCQNCNPLISQTAWSPAPDGTPCPTGTCAGGTCN